MTKINTEIPRFQMPKELKQPNKLVEQDKELRASKEADKAAGGFEALLLHNMLKEMWGTTQGGEGILDESSNEMQIFKDMFSQAVADEVVKGEGIGVKGFLKKELSNIQTGASKVLGTEDV